VISIYYSPLRKRRDFRPRVTRADIRSLSSLETCAIPFFSDKRSSRRKSVLVASQRDSAPKVQARKSLAILLAGIRFSDISTCNERNAFTYFPGAPANGRTMNPGTSRLADRIQIHRAARSGFICPGAITRAHGDPHLHRKPFHHGYSR